MRVKRNFDRIWIAMEKPLVKWGPGPNWVHCPYSQTDECIPFGDPRTSTETMANAEDLKATATAAVDALSVDLNGISESIWNNPELGKIIHLDTLLLGYVTMKKEGFECAAVENMYVPFEVYATIRA